MRETGFGEPADSKTVGVTIAGERFSLHGRADAAYMLHLAEQIDGKMSEIKERLPKAPLIRLALLVALNLADEAEQLRQKSLGSPEGLETLAESIDSLLALLQDSFP